MSYGQIRRKSSAAAKARLMSDSWSWHSDSSEGLRSAQIGSPIPRIPPSLPAWSPTKRFQAGMMRAGLRPTTSMSAKCTWSARTPSAIAQKLELSAPHHHQHRLAALQAVLDEGTRALDELVIARVEHGLVMKGPRGGHGEAHR